MMDDGSMEEQGCAPGSIDIAGAPHGAVRCWIYNRLTFEIIRASSSCLRGYRRNDNAPMVYYDFIHYDFMFWRPSMMFERVCLSSMINLLTSHINTITHSFIHACIHACMHACMKKRSKEEMAAQSSRLFHQRAIKAMIS
jgi:hypothetical protein